MPHRLREDLYCTSDTVYEHPLASVTFLLKGKRIFIVKNYDDYLELKRAVTVTHRIESIEPCGGLYKCEMCGSDGSILTFYLTDDDIHHNMMYTENRMGIQQIQAVCSVFASLFLVEMLFFIS